ncbi:MAG: hypothetical protein FWF59_15140 [Turicibacter sp.]|nr:hypothetical protein [Turicibacter sp.]
MESQHLELIKKERSKLLMPPGTYVTRNPFVIENFLLFHEEGLDKANLETYVTYLTQLDEELIGYAIQQFLLLLQDKNWPGSQMAYNFLINSHPNIYMEKLETCFEVALTLEDFDWILNLYELMVESSIDERDFKNYTLFRNLVEKVNSLG